MDEKHENKIKKVLPLQKHPKELKTREKLNKRSKTLIYF